MHLMLKRKSTKPVAVIGLAAVVVGGLGLLVGIKLFPSNLLGGLAFIFGPLYWLGWVLLLFAALGWYRNRRPNREDGS